MGLTRLFGLDNMRLYEGILLKALQTCNQDVIWFCKEQIYPLYLDACLDAKEQPDEHYSNIYGRE